MPSRGASLDLKSIAKDLTALVAPVRQFDRPALEGEMATPSGTRLIVVTRNGFTGETPRSQGLILNQGLTAQAIRAELFNCGQN